MEFLHFLLIVKQFDYFCGLYFIRWFCFFFQCYFWGFCKWNLEWTSQSTIVSIHMRQVGWDTTLRNRSCGEGSLYNVKMTTMDLRYQCGRHAVRSSKSLNPHCESEDVSIKYVERDYSRPALFGAVWYIAMTFQYYPLLPRYYITISVRFFYKLRAISLDVTSLAKFKRKVLNFMD